MRRAVLTLALLTLTGAAERSAEARSDSFGTRPDGQVIQRHILVNRNGMTVELMDQGAAIVRIARKLPTGWLLPVSGTASDFTRDRPLALVLRAGGIDEMLILSSQRTAQLTDPGSGRALTVTTNQPGLQLFTGNAFDGADRDRAGYPIPRHAAIALDPGHFAASPAIPAFPSTRVAPGEPLRWRLTWRFGRVAATSTKCTP